MLDRLFQQQSVSGTMRRTMTPPSKSSQLPKLVVELAQTVGVSAVATRTNPASPGDSDDSEAPTHGCSSGCSCDALYSGDSCVGSGSSTGTMSEPFAKERSVSSDDNGRDRDPQDVNLLTASWAFQRSVSESSSTGGSAESPVPRAYLFDDDSSGSSGGASSGGASGYEYQQSGTTSPQDLQILSRTADRLSECGFYFRGLNHTDARCKLKDHPPGTFLLRDSWNSNFIYTLSAKTPRGTTSVRIAYTGGRFRMDCDPHLVSSMPRFFCILELVQYYLSVSKRKGSKCVWFESSGRRDTPVILTAPLREQVLSLKHLTRKAVHRTVSNDKLEQLPVTSQILEYLQKYPFHV